MASYTFTVPGNPARWMVFTKRGRPPPSWHLLQEYKARIAQVVKDTPGVLPLRGRVELTLIFARGTPARAPKGAEKRLQWQQSHIIKRPDLTNYQKAAEDALTGLLYQDDSQVVMVHSGKRYTDEPEGYTHITVAEIEEDR